MNIGEQKKSSPWRRLAIVLCIMLLGLVVSTQHFAHSMRYQEVLGFNIYKVYPPWEIILWYIQWGEAHPKPFLLSMSIGLIASTVLLAFYLIKTLVDSRKATVNVNLHGSARWATEKEIADAGLFSDEGVFVGGWWDKKIKDIVYLRHNGPEHICCIAPTRSGKGVGLVLPTLLTWKKSTVISDLKGELWAYTAGWRKTFADNIVIKFEPAAIESAKWNVFNEIRIGTEYEVGDVQAMAELIVDPNGKGLVDHWQKTSKALLDGCIIHLLYQEINKEIDYEEWNANIEINKPPFREARPANLAALDGMLADSSRPIEELWKEMTKYKHIKYGLDQNGNKILLPEEQWKTHPVAQRAGQDMLDRPDEEGGSVLSTAKSFLSLYRDPLVEKNTSESNFLIHDLMNHEKPVSLYIITQPADKDRLKPLVRLMITMIVRIQASNMIFKKDEKGNMKAQGNYKHRQLLMIDEFPSLGKLTILEESLAFIAGYGMKFYGICQDRNQLTSEQNGYGRDETITSNCHIIIAYAPNRPETAEYLSKKLGQTTVIKEQISASGKLFGPILGNINKSYSEVQRPLMTPDEITRLPGPKKAPDGSILEAGDMIVCVAGYQPIYGKQSLYFKDEVMDDRTKISPPKKSDIIRGNNSNKIKDDFKLPIYKDAGI